MKRILCLAVLVFVTLGRPASGQQNEIAALKAELAKQQAVIAQLLTRVQELEARQTAPVTKDDLQREAQTQQDAVNSVRESLLGRVNLNGYYNSRFSADSSETPTSFQQHHLGVLLGKQLGRFNVFTELELQNVPHHAEIRPNGEGERSGEGEGHAMRGTSAEKARWRSRTPGWNTITTATSTFESGSSCRPSTGGRITTRT